MAVIGIHKTQAVLPGVMLTLMKFAKSFEFIGWQDYDIAVYRIQHDELPEEDIIVALQISFQQGLDPFVCNIINHETLWQPLNT